MEADYDWQMLNSQPIGVSKRQFYFSRLKSTLISQARAANNIPAIYLRGLQLGNVGFCYRKQ